MRSLYTLSPCACSPSHSCWLFQSECQKSPPDESLLQSLDELLLLSLDEEQLLSLVE